MNTIKLSNFVFEKLKNLKSSFYCYQFMRTIIKNLNKKKLLIRCLLIVSIPIVFIFGLKLAVAWEWIGSLPSNIDLQSIDNPIASELYAADEELIGRYYVENRSPLGEDDINDYFKNALIATEDVRFLKHHGVDNRSLLRVFFKTILLQKDNSGGGSTITQQLAKNLYPRKRYKFLSLPINKFREMSIARRLEKIYSKDEILMLYTNTVSFGERAFGLPTASKRFFNKKPSELLLEEAATLVGMLKAPTYYSPRNHPERAAKRRNVVLGQMVKYDFIANKVYDQVSKLSVNLDYQSTSADESLARYFQRYVEKEFKNWSLSSSKDDGSKYNIYRDGLKIYTSIDLNMQIAAERIMQNHMKALQTIFVNSWKGGKMFGPNTKIIDEKIIADPLYLALKAKGLSKQELLTAFTTKGNRKIWTWDGYEKLGKTKIDSIKHYLGLLHTGILAVAPQTGEIKAWVGGNDYGAFQWDNVLSPQQVGSTFKPIVYLAALDQGIEPCDYFPNELRTYTDYKGWTPRNADSEYGGYMPVKTALTHSVNTVSVQLLFEAGMPKVVKTARALGITSKLNEVPSIVLGTSDISLFEMVSAYATIANNGNRIPLTAIRKIEDSDGKVLFENEKLEMEEMDIPAEKFKLLKGMMKNVVAEGTGRRLYANYDIPYTLMGKTGTTQNQSDGWFIGFSENLVIGAWVGTHDRRIHFRNLGTGSGGRTALPLVAALFEYAATTDDYPNFPFVEETIYECPSYLNEEEYQYLQEYLKRQEEIGQEVYTDVQDAIDEEKKDNERAQDAARRRKYNPEIQSKESERIQKQREDRLKQIEKERRKWQKKLERLKKKDARRRKRN